MKTVTREMFDVIFRPLADEFGVELDQIESIEVANGVVTVRAFVVDDDGNVNGDIIERKLHVVKECGPVDCPPFEDLRMETQSP